MLLVGMTGIGEAFDRAMPEGFLPTTLEEVLASAPIGLPRPRHFPSNLPIPWIANPLDLSDANAFRRAVCVVQRRCQVCGDYLDATAVVCWRAGDALVVDGAGVHPKECWPLASHACPELARMIADGSLIWREVPTSSLREVETDNVHRHDGMPVSYEVPTE